MENVLFTVYPWVRAFHVISVISWMAGLFYLPRLFVYHASTLYRNGVTDQMLITMERRLLHAIMNPAMVATWVFGIILAITPGTVDWSALWPWIKVSCVLAMTWFHHWLAMRRKEFSAGTNERTERHYRFMNEVPTILVILIVVSVVVRPF